MRSKKAIINAVTILFSQILILLLNFILRKVFLFYFNTEYLGVNGLFNSVVSMLSVAELGVGTAITFSLYKPLAQKDYDIINGLMYLFKSIYRIIGICILVVGIAITPIVLQLVEIETEIPLLAVIYILFVINASISYFFSFSRTLIVADQQEYKLAVIDNLSKLLLIGFQALILIFTRNYILYLVMQIIMTFVQNFAVYLKVKKNYKEVSFAKKKLPEDIKKTIKKNISAMIIYKLAIVSVSSSDNLIISKMLGTVFVGLYSNYSMVILTLQTISSKLITGITATIGNVVAEENDKKTYGVLELLQYLCFIIYCILCSTLFSSINPFIRVFYGKEFLLDIVTVIVLLINFYLLGMQGATSIFRDTKGIFVQGKLRPLFQGILNIVISIALVLLMHNLTAVFLGTIISRLLTITWYEPYAIHKYGFGSTSKLFYFYEKKIMYFLMAVSINVITYIICSYIPVKNILSVLIIAMVAFAVSTILVGLSTMFTREYKHLVGILKGVLHAKNVKK